MDSLRGGAKRGIMGTESDRSEENVAYRCVCVGGGAYRQAGKGHTVAASQSWAWRMSNLKPGCAHTGRARRARRGQRDGARARRRMRRKISGPREARAGPAHLIQLQPLDEPDELRGGERAGAEP